VSATLLAGIATCALASVASAEDSEPAAHKTISEVVVTGERLATASTSGTKTDTPLIETPQSISVLDATTINRLGLQNLNQTLRLVAGVTPETRGSAAEVYDQFKLRGFDAPIYLDGLRLFASATGYAVPQVDVSRLDRVEVLKGPASALYGQSSPGGLVDEASKLPLDAPIYGAVAGTYGSYNLYRFDGDIGGQTGSKVLWRLYGSLNGANQQQDYGKRERQTISGAVTLTPESRTSLTLLAAYSHDPFNGDYGVWPALGTLVHNPAGQISTKFYGGEPDDFFRRNQAGLTYILNHDLGGGWAFRASGRYQYVESQLGIVYTTGSPVDFADPAPTVFSRASYATREQLNDWTFDNRLTGAFDTGPLRHSVLLGFDDQIARSKELYAFGSGTPIDVFHPAYGTMPTPQTPYEVPAYGPGFVTPTLVSTRQTQQGVYAQDQVSLGGLRVTLSGRQDWASQDAGGQSQHDHKFTWRAGALYLTPSGVAPYVSYSTSFEPQAALLQDGSFAKPSVGKQIEAGVKYQPRGLPLLLTAAWFRIEQSNIVVYDPVSFAANQVGKARSQGVEIEASGSLPYGFNARVAFSRQSVKDIEDVNPAAIGQGLATVGRGGLTANLDWAPKSGPAQGLVIGGTIRHVDRVYADRYFDGIAYNSPAYTVFDALVRYDLGGLNPRLHGVTAGLNIANLFDKTYLTSCFANYGWCWYGNRRTVQGTIGFRW
jgi:iron complex outermembrane receptor protein